MANPNPDEIDLSDSDFFSNPSSNQNHETPDADPDADAALMASTLGFTSFGTQYHPDPAEEDSNRPSKKRRFNPQSDNAVIAGPIPHHSSVDQGETFYEGEDGESILTAYKAQHSQPSGGKKPKPKRKPNFDDQAYVDDDDPNEDDDEDFDENSGSEIAASRPRRSRSATPLSERVTHPGGRGGDRGARGGARGVRGGGRGGRGGSYGNANANANAEASKWGAPNPNWYVDYYDISSNVNPWEALERARGLAPVGTWLTAGAAGVGAGADAKTGNGNGMKEQPPPGLVSAVSAAVGGTGA